MTFILFKCLKIGMCNSRYVIVGRLWYCPMHDVMWLLCTKVLCDDENMLILFAVLLPPNVDNDLLFDVDDEQVWWGLSGRTN